MKHSYVNAREFSKFVTFADLQSRVLRVSPNALFLFDAQALGATSNPVPTISLPEFVCINFHTKQVHNISGYRVSWDF